MVENEDMLKLMDMFAINAPACPSWFVPQMDEKPKEPELPEYIDDNLKNCFRHEDRPQINQNKYPDFAKQMEDFWNSLDDWTMKNKIEKLTQWPYFYAKLMLEKRSEIQIGASLMPHS